MLESPANAVYEGELLATNAQLPVKRGDRFFYIAVALLAAAIVFAGFARTYYLKSLYGNPPLRPFLHLHGFLFTSWLVLLFTQVTLVAAKRTDVHRRLGVVGGVLAVLMVLVGTTAAIQSASRGFAPAGSPGPLVFLAIPIFDMMMFAILVGAAFYYRRQPDTHKRLMLVATISILDAAIARLPIAFVRANGPLAFFGLTDTVLLACILYDTVSHRRLHPAYAWGAILLFMSQPLRLFLGHTTAWLAFAHFVVR